MKPTADDVLKAIKGLAIAAARVRELATEHGKDNLLGDMPRRQKDAVRQHLLEIKTDVETVLRIMTQRNTT
jgi:phage FluMu gp28-like protein